MILFSAMQAQTSFNYSKQKIYWEIKKLKCIQFLWNHKMVLKRKTVREVLYYEYAKIIANSALGMNEKSSKTEKELKRYWGLVRSKFEDMKHGKMSPSGVIRENKMLIQKEGQYCAYCGSTSDLQWEHIVPLSRGGPDTIDNLVRACRNCNISKGGKTPSELYENRWHQIPRIVRGKYVKVLMAEHEKQGTLDLIEFPPGQALSMRTLSLIFSEWKTNG